MTPRIFDTDRGQIRYWLSENVDPNAITLVFLPGLTADHRLFDKQISHFEGRVNVLTWDAPGHAASRPFVLDFNLFGFISIDSAPLPRKFTTAAEIWLLKHIEPVYRMCPWKTLVSAGAGHNSNTDAPEIVNSLNDGFIIP